MDLFDNPFRILGATAVSSRSEIMELFQEKSLFEDSDTCTQARLCLTTPKKRLMAELSWFFCLFEHDSDDDFDEHVLFSPDQILGKLLDIDEDASVEELCAYEESFTHLAELCSELYDKFKFADEQDDCFDDIPRLGWLSVLNLCLTLCQRFNSRVALQTVNLFYESNSDDNGKSCVVLMLIKASSQIELDQLLISLNDLREKSGLPRIESQVDLREAWNEHLQAVQHELMRVFEQLPSAWLSKILCQCIDYLDPDFPFLLRQVIEQYELGAKSYFDQQLSFIAKCFKQATITQIMGLEWSVIDKYLQLANKAIEDYVTILKPISLKDRELNETNVGPANKLFNVWFEEFLSKGTIFSRKFEHDCFNGFCKQMKGMGDVDLDDCLDNCTRQMNTCDVDQNKLIHCLQLNGSTLYIHTGWLLYLDKKYFWSDCTEFALNPLNHLLHLVFYTNAQRYEFNLDIPNLKSCEKAILSISRIFMVNMIERWKKCLQFDLPIPFNGYTIWNEGMENNDTHALLRWADMKIVESESGLVPGFEITNTKTNSKFAFFRRLQDNNILLLAILIDQIKGKPRLLSDVWKDELILKNND